MGRLSIQGSGAASFMDSLVTFSVKTLQLGRARYGFILADNGGILDDVILYHSQVEDGSDSLRLVCNAANRYTVIAWMDQHLTAFRGVTVNDHTAETVLIAVQGPRALQVMDDLCPDDPKPSALRPFGASLFPLDVGGGAVAEGFVGRDRLHRRGRRGNRYGRRLRPAAVGGAHCCRRDALRARCPRRAAVGGRATPPRL